MTEEDKKQLIQNAARRGGKIFMTDLEKKAEEYVINLYGVTNGFFYENKKRFNNHLGLVDYDLINSEKAYKDGYEQGQKDFDTDVTKFLNSYGIKFIDTNSIGGLIALHQLMLELEKENGLLKSKIKNVYKVRQKAQSEMIIDLEKENEELKAQIEDIANINIKAQTIIADQKQQIIKMKCCGNCKHYRYDYEDRYCLYDATRDKDCVNYSEWELAE